VAANPALLRDFAFTILKTGTSNRLPKFLQTTMLKNCLIYQLELNSPAVQKGGKKHA
jgi:hypothetical protein